MKRTIKQTLSCLLAAAMILSTCVFSGMNFDALFAVNAEAANYSKTLTVTANTSGTLFDSKATHLNLWQKSVVGNASEAPLEFIEYIEIMNATGGGDGQSHPTVSSNGSISASSTDRDLIDATTGNFITAKLTDLTNSIDSIIAVGAKPLIKLGGVPFYFTMTTNPNKWIEAAMNCNPYPPDADITYTTKYYSAGTTKTGYEGYQYYLMDVIQYLINKYTLAEVRTWRWGVLTEFENKDWFYTYSDRNRTAGSTFGTDSADAFCMLYDYSAEAVISLLGEFYTYIGAHAMAVSEGIWDENLFIEHIADGFNFAKGDTKLGVNGAAVSTTSSNRHGVHCDYIAVSFYDPSLGSASYNVKTFTQTVDYIRNEARSKANSLTSGVVNAREQASANTLNNLKYGIDEGRILSGTSGANSDALNSRTVGYTIQGAYDARMYYQMVEDDIDYLSSWSFTSNGAGLGFPAITYHVADKTGEMAGTNRYKATVTGGSGITSKPNSSTVECNAYGSYDTTESKMRIMAYNFCNNYSYTTPADLTLNVNLPSSFAGKNVKVKMYAIDDDANFFDEWKTDCAANGLSTSAFSWSMDDPEIESGNTCLSAGLALAASRRNYYKSCSQLIPTAQILTANSSGQVTISYTGMQANSATYFEIEETDLTDEKHTVYFDVNDGSGARTNLLPLMFEGETTFSESGVDYSYDPVTGVFTLDGTAVRNSTDSQDIVVIRDIPITKLNGAKFASGDAVTISSEGVGGSVSGGGIVAELYTSDGKSVATKAGLTGTSHANGRCQLSLYDINNQSASNTVPGSGVTAEYCRLFVYIPDGGSQATFSNFKFKLKVENGDGATKYTPNARIINHGDVYREMPSVERTNYKLNTWKLNTASVNSSSTFTSGSDVTLVAVWDSNPSCDVYFNVNHDSIGVNLFKPTLDNTTYSSPYAGHSGSINYSYNQNTGVISLNGSIKGIQYGESTQDNNFYLVSVPITTTAGTQYAATIDFLSGSITAAGTTLSPAIVVDMSSFIPSTAVSLGTGEARSYLNAPSVGTFKSTSTGSGTWKAPAATSYLVFWVWCDGTQFHLNDVKLKVKVAQESTATEYSPNAKQCSQGQGYGIVQEPAYRQGYKFDGWYTAQTGGTRVSATSTCPNSSSTTLWAHWTQKPTYTVTFDKQGGSGGEASKVVTADVNPPALTSIPTKSGYRFGGYFTQTKGKGTCYFGEDGTGSTPYVEGANTTLYANWISSSDVKSSSGTSTGTCFFNVPETIYLKTNALTFEFVNDQELTSSGGYTANKVVGGKSISSGGKVQFYAPGVTSVDFAWYMGNESCSATVGGTSGSSGKVTVSSKNSNGVFETTITAGSLNTYNSDTRMITWVASYIKDGRAYSYVHYTTIYSPLAGNSSTLCTMMSSRVKSSGDNYPCISRYSTWCIGLNGIDVTTHSAGTGDASGKPNNSMKEPPTTNTTFTNKTCRRNDPGNSDNDFIFESGGKGFSGWYKCFDASKGTYNTSYTSYWEGIVYGDNFRYANLNQIPGLRIGMDLHEFWTCGSSETSKASLGYYAEGATANRTNAIAEYCPKEVESSGVRLGLSTAYRMDIDVSSVTNEKDTIIYGYGYHKGNYAIYESGHAYSYVRYIVRDKSNLRSKIQEVYTKMGCFSDLTAKCQKDLMNNLRQACYVLGDPSASPANIASAESALNSIYYEKRTGTATFNDYKMIGNTTKTLVNTETIKYNFGDTVTSTAGIYEGYSLASTTTTQNRFNSTEFCNITQASESSSLSSISTYGTNGISVVSSSGTDNYTTMPWANAYGCELTRNLYRVAVKPNTTYRLYADISGTDTKDMMIFALKAYGDITSGQWTGITGTENGSSYVQYTTPSDCYYVSFRFGNKESNATTYFNNIRFVEYGGSNPTSLSNSNCDSITFDRVYNPYVYTIAYNLNGGSGTTPASQTKYHDTAITLTANITIPTKAGYTYLGWNTKADGSGVDYSPGDIFTANGPTPANGETITLYAKWKNYTVTINPNGGTYNGSSSNTVTNVTAGTTYSFGEPTRPGYNLAGWTIENMPTDSYILGNGYSQNFSNVGNSYGLYLESNPKSDSDGTYTNYKCYGTNNTSGDMYPQINLRVNYAIAAGDTVTVTMDYRRNSGSITTTLYNGATANDYAAGTVSLTATSWTSITSTRTFTAASSTGQIQISAGQIIAAASATEASPFFDIDVKNIKIKITHSGGSSEYVPSLLTMPKGDVVLTANWAPKTYTIQYNNNNGTGTSQTSTQAVDYEDIVNLKTQAEIGFTKTGYSIYKWGTNASSYDSTNSTDPGSQIDVSSLVTALGKQNEDKAVLNLYAHWKESMVYFDVNHDNIKPNLFAPEVNTTSSQGVTFSYDKATGIYTLNGTQTAGTTNFVYSAFTPESGATYRATVEYVGGSKTAGNGCVVLDFAKDNRTTNLSTRKYLDFNLSSSTKTVASNFTFDATALSECRYIRLWVHQNSTAANVFDNLQFKVKIEKTSSSTEQSPAGRPITGDTYGSLPNNPKREGYTFAGWYTAAEGGSMVGGTSAYTSRWNHTLYAHWTPNPYTITYDNYFSLNSWEAKTGSFAATGGTLTNNGDGTFSFANTNASGESYTRSRHATNGYNSDYYYFPVTAGQTLYVSYDYMRTVKNAAGTNASVEMFMFFFDGDYTYKSLKNFVGTSSDINNYHTVTGTVTVPDGVSYVNVRFDNNTPGDTVKYKNVRVMPNTAPYNTQKYLTSVTYPATEDIYIFGSSKNYNTAISNFDTARDPSYTGYNFAGWYTGPNGTGTEISGSTQVLAKDHAVFASWTPRDDTRYTVEVYVMNTSGTYPSTATASKTYTGTTDASVSITSSNFSTYATISGTGITSSNVGQFSLDTTKGVLTGTIINDGSAVFKVYAKRAQHTLTLNATTNGGTVTPTSVTLYYGQTYTLPTATKANYNHIGWDTSSSATTASYAKNGTYTMGTADATLYAIFNRTFTVTFHWYNNQSTPVTVTIYNGATSGTVTIPTHNSSETVSGVTYALRGWSTTNTANATTAVAASATTISGINSNRDYYASYSASITGTFYYCSDSTTYSGTGVSYATATANATRYMSYTGGYVQSNYTVPTAVTGSKGGYIAENYVGVSTSANSTTTVATPTTANTTFYAVYNESLTFYYWNGSAHTSTSMNRYMLFKDTTTKYYSKLDGTVPTPATYNNAAWTGKWTYDSTQYASSYERAPLTTGANSLYAKYSKTITLQYDGNTTTTNVPATQTGTAYFVSKSGGINAYNYNLAVTSSIPTWDGHTFIKWNTVAGGTGTDYTAGSNVSYSDAKTTVTLYAQWEIYYADVYAYSNTAKNATETNDYTNSNVGGTVSITAGTGSVVTDSDNTHSIAAVTAGNTVSITATPATGYDFDGWYTDSALTTLFSSDATVTTAAMTSAGLKYYAKFSIHAYTITTTAMYRTATSSNAIPSSYTTGTTGGTIQLDATDITSTTCYYGQSVTLTAKSKTGYTISSWVGGTTVSSDKKTCTVSNVTANITVNARFSTKTVKVCAFAYVNSLESADFTNAATGGTVSVSGVTSSRNNNTLAPYGYVYYKKDGGSVIAGAATTGYTFKGWQTAVPTTSNTTYVTTDATYSIGVISGTKNVYARYEINSYQITFNLNGGTGGTVTGYYSAPGTQVSAATALSASPITMVYTSTATIAPPTRKGYTFMGWEVASGSGSLTNATTPSSGDATFTVGADNATLNAIWDPNPVTVVYKHGTHGTGADQSETFKFDASYTTKAGSIFTGDSYTITFNANNGDWSGATTKTATATWAFNCWKSDANNGNYNAATAYTDNLGLDDDGTVTLTAQWKGATVSAPATNPARRGYTFAGWYTEANGGTAFSASTQHSAATTYYAHWTADTYTLAINKNGGTDGSPTSFTLTFDSAYTATFTTLPSRTGWELVGFSASSSATSATYTVDSSKQMSLTQAQVNNLYTSKNATVTLYAIWRCTPKVRFYYINTSGAQAYSDVNCTTVYNSTTSTSCTAPSVTSISGWTEKGFSTSTSYTDSGLIAEGATISNINTLTNGTVVANYYMNYNKEVTLSYNANGGTLSGAATEKATATRNASSTAITKAPFTAQAAATKSGSIFLGWSAVGSDSNTVAYVPGDSLTLENNGTIKAIWFTENSSIVHESESDKNVDVVIGYDSNGDVISESVWKYNDKDRTSYDNALTAYKTAQNNVKTALSTVGSSYSAANKTALLNAETVLKNAESALITVKNSLTVKTVVKDYIDAFRVSTDNNSHSVHEINLNHYVSGVLDNLKTAYDGANNVSNAALITSSAQTTINNCVKTLAENFVNKGQVTSTPQFNIYETTEALKDSGFEAANGLVGANNVVIDKGAKTYYLYTNNPNTNIVVAIDDVSSGGRACYPTTVNSDVSVAETVVVTDPDNSSKTIKTTTTLTDGSSQYNINDEAISSKSDFEIIEDRYNPGKTDNAHDYIGSGLGTAYSGVVNGKTYTGADYYERRSFITLTPQFDTEALRSEFTYTFTAHNDSKNLETAKQASLRSNNDLVNGTNAITDSINESQIKIIVCYKPKGGFNVTYDQWGNGTNYDYWLKQFHLYRTSGGASNWEIPGWDTASIKDKSATTHAKPINLYAIEDSSFDTTDNTANVNYCSFTYTFTADMIPKFNTYSSQDPRDSLCGKTGYSSVVVSAYETAINTSTNLQEVKSYIKNLIGKESDFATVATSAQYKFTGKNVGGTGTGFVLWPGTTSWSFNYYPASKAYTYVHLIDRWGNVVDKIVPVPNMDYTPTKAANTSSAGSATITESGGSGIATASLNAGSIQIITDDSSTLVDNVYRTTGNTVKLYTGEANKSYTLSLTDNATNATTASVKTDADGYLTLTVEDEDYNFDGTAYTFTLGNYEINLYDGVIKHIKSVTNGSAYVGEKATATIVTSDQVTMAQLKNPETGSTTTATTYVENDNGTRIWTISKNGTEGEHEYIVRVKVNGTWVDEGKTAKLTYTNKPVPTIGEVVKVEYTPSLKTRNIFNVTVTGTPDRVQIVYPDGGTSTFMRDNVAIKGIEKTSDGELWSIQANLLEGEYSARARYNGTWSGKTVFTVTLLKENVPDTTVYSIDIDGLEYGSITRGKHEITVVTGKDVTAVMLKNTSTGSTDTFTESNATVEEVEGKLEWKFNMSFSLGNDKTYLVKVRTEKTKFQESDKSITFDVVF